MVKYELTAENLLATLPLPLAEDQKMRAIASSIAQLLSSCVTEIDKAALYQTILSMPSDLLDILSDDFKVNWYCPSDALPERRATIEMLWRVHRAMGTAAAVAAAISSLYPVSSVVEWYEYWSHDLSIGFPYHFKLCVPIRPSHVTPEIEAQILQQVETCKNARSVLDDIEYVGILLVDERGAVLMDEEKNILIGGDDE